MIKSWILVVELLRKNALHRKGWRLGDAEPILLLKHVAEELSAEFGDSRSIKLIKEELVDVLGCLIVFAIKMEFDLKELDDLLVEKLKLRFKE